MKIVFEIVTEQSGVAQGINDLRKRIKDLNKEINNVNNTPDQIEKYTRELVTCQNEVKDLTERQKSLNREFQQTRVPTDSLAGLRLEYERLTSTITKYSAAERKSPTGQANIAQAANLKKTINGLEADLGRFTGNVGNYQKAFGTFAGVIGKVGAAFAVLQGGNAIIDTTRETEKFFAILKQATGNESAALRIFEQIKQFALETPFQLNELVGSFVKLEQRNFKPTIEQLRVLGDISSALGKNVDQLVEAILDAQQGEFERLKEFGIKFKKDGDNLKAEFKGQRTEIANTAESISAYLLSLGKLPSIQGAASAVAATLDGAISNLVDNFTQLGANIGSSGGLLQGFVEGISSGIAEINRFISTPLSEKLQEQQGEFNALVNILKDVNIEESTRNQAIQQLQKDYPDYIGNIDLNTASQEDLNKVLEDGNKLFLQRIFLQQNEEKFADFARRRIALERQLFEERKRAQNASSGEQGSLSSLAGAFESTAPQFTLTAINQLNEEVKAFTIQNDELSKSLFGSKEAAADAKKEYDNLRGFDKDSGVKGVASASTEAAGSVEALRKAVEKAREALEKSPQNKLAAAVETLKKAEQELLILETRIETIRSGKAVTVRGATINKSAVSGGDIPESAIPTQDGAGLQIGTTDAQLEAAIENNLELVDNTEFTAEEILQLEKALSEKKIGLTEEELKKRLELEEQAEKRRKELRKLGIDSAIQAAEDVAGAVFQIDKNRLEKETDSRLSALDESYKKQIEAAQGNVDLQEQLQKELEDKKAAIEKEAANKRKELAKKEALINIALSIVKALTGAPPPANFILAGAAAVAGGAQLAVIENTQFAKGGFTGDGFNFRDSTGRRVAGVVHENEYVAPQSQIQRYPWIFDELERDRLANLRPFAAGGFTSTIVPNFPTTTATTNSGFQQDVTGFTDSQVKILGANLGGIIGEVVGFEVRRQLAAGIDDNNRLQERQNALTQSRKV